jgi:glycerate kinase
LKQNGSENMKIVIAPDSFKGSLSAKEICDCIEKGIRKVNNSVEIVKVPMADGGEGTVQSLIDCTGGTLVKKIVRDPLCRGVEAFYGILGDRKTAVIEMAAASGLPLLEGDERNPLITTTFGTGELIRDSMDRGCSNLIIGLGGSATNDGGAGMLMALGAKFLDGDGYSIGLGGKYLKRLRKIDLSGLDERIKKCSITAACDVNNPLCGPSGASHVFGPQKGADENAVKILDDALLHFAEVIKKDLGISVADLPGAGAAGGLGAGLTAFLNAKLKKGIDIVIETTGFEDKVRNADIVITGEGSIDYQTQFGKTPYGVAVVAGKYGVPVIGICGSIGDGVEVLYSKGFNSIFSIIDKPMSLEEALEKSAQLVEDAAERIIRSALIFSSRSA